MFYNVQHREKVPSAFYCFHTYINLLGNRTQMSYDIGTLVCEDGWDKWDK